jgi:hypothetical protein
LGLGNLPSWSHLESFDKQESGESWNEIVSRLYAERKDVRKENKELKTRNDKQAEVIHWHLGNHNRLVNGKEIVMDSVWVGSSVTTEIDAT